jgi:predicted Rossmann-fold nucleotide-binding protein
LRIQQGRPPRLRSGGRAPLSYLDHAETEGFLRAENRRMLLVDAEARGLLRQFERYVAPNVDKWIDG